MISNTSIVIADDMEPILSYFEKILSSVTEFKIVGKARNGKELIRAVVENSPDLVITDIEMPDCTGIEAIEQLNKLDVKTKYIVVTGNESTIIDNKKHLGISRIIKKPIINDEKFIQEIQCVINSKKEENDLKNIKFEEPSIVNIECVNNKKENKIIQIIKKILKSKKRTIEKVNRD